MTQQALAQRQAQENATGQYVDPKRSHTVGETVIRGGKEYKITKMYPDKSFDMEED